MPTPDLTGDQLHRRIGRNTWFLAAMLLAGCAYIAWISLLGSLSGYTRLDGALGILLGLYICSHPAANTLDMLLFMRADTRESILGNNAGRLWLLMNVLVGVGAWGVIFTGILRFVARSQ